MQWANDGSLLPKKVTWEGLELISKKVARLSIADKEKRGEFVTKGA